MTYVVISEDLESKYFVFENLEEAKAKRDYFNSYEKNSRYIVAEAELDEDGVPNLENYDVIE